MAQSARNPDSSFGREDPDWCHRAQDLYSGYRFRKVCFPGDFGECGPC